MPTHATGVAATGLYRNQQARTPACRVRSLLDEIMQSQSFREAKLQQGSSVSMPFRGRKKEMAFVWNRVGHLLCSLDLCKYVKLTLNASCVDHVAIH
jgi:hypothetical protein